MFKCLSQQRIEQFSRYLWLVLYITISGGGGSLSLSKDIWMFSAVINGMWSIPCLIKTDLNVPWSAGGVVMSSGTVQALDSKEQQHRLLSDGPFSPWCSAQVEEASNWWHRQRGSPKTLVNVPGRATVAAMSMYIILFLILLFTHMLKRETTAGNCYI